MAHPRTPRQRWIRQATSVLAEDGPDAVRIESLAKTLGVTKGGFYGYFADRNALLSEVLDVWEQASVDEVLATVEHVEGDPQAQATLAGQLTFSETLRPVDLAVRDWARRDPAVAERLRRVDNRRMDLLRTAISTVCHDRAEVEARSFLAFCAAIGSEFLAADHQGISSQEIRTKAADILFRPVEGAVVPAESRADTAAVRFVEALIGAVPGMISCDPEDDRSY